MGFRPYNFCYSMGRKKQKFFIPAESVRYFPQISCKTLPYLIQYYLEMIKHPKG